MNTQQKLNSLGLEIPYILLPQASQNSQQKSDLAKWPVIACDQFTQDRGYWDKVKTAAAGCPSAFNLIYPEVFLSEEESQPNLRAQRIADIHSNMSRYLEDGVFAPPRRGFIYIERDTPFHKKRRGLVAAVDLEKYDWHPQSRPLIRCTEGTVPERLPPRMDIRRGAPLELPHVLLLIDDAGSFAAGVGSCATGAGNFAAGVGSCAEGGADTLLYALGEKVKNNAPVYSTPLMMESGHVTGWFIDSEEDLSFIAGKLDDLCRRSLNRYAAVNENPGAHSAKEFLFAVGDGNHSLAAAKGIWEEYKNSTKNPQMDHPLRYALVEIENIYDPAIQFEPIHRLAINISFEKIISLLSRLPDFSCKPMGSAKELSKIISERPENGNCFGVISNGHYALIETSACGISTACLQPLLDEYLTKGQSNYLTRGQSITLSPCVDYIHDEDELFRLSDNGSSAENHQSAGILLPPVQKSGFFETIARTGPLPRKSFSMGYSCEKRFYLECRSLS